MFNHSWLTRFLALSMIGGSAVALCFLALTVHQKINEGAYDAVAVFVTIALLFLWSLYVGYRFIKGDAWAYRWVLGLFVTQIPIVAWGPVEMRWSTGFEIPVILNGVQEKLLYLTYHANIGFESGFVFGGSVEETALGINVFAFIASIVLFRARKRVLSTNGEHIEASAQ
ncbi:hypothetical protein [Agrobacterium rubi]|uniref:Uncharacterized protein n=1 Tax=Agrobacterium rubi TaxID=28099 RepID=A0AAE7UQ70_9HYPH|nr:hypothetical protein [Agrobacterium rubi]NTE86667.1 hypothetical protein [Agrobacterium rubi]NTF02599.1 hypothetical protein [Agrobacterium rubi]NTF36845.1 hypothetical protein [Agrobacterium rubi]OCJ55541.1 hypothetical protein A6U92_02840 [Agrobacterium rubi]QTF99289.1 hypothetical protein G6M88_02220 [Agrobacterium rubi]